MQILKEDDANWPPPDKAGRQELEIILGEAHISFTTTKLGSLMQVQQSKDPDGLRIFYYLVQARPQKSSSRHARCLGFCPALVVTCACLHNVCRYKCPTASRDLCSRQACYRSRMMPSEILQKCSYV